MSDIIIAGAGPAGAIAAFTLASRGCRVVLADRMARPRRATGEALPAQTVRLLAAAGIVFDPGAHEASPGKLTCWSSDELITTDFLFDPHGAGMRLDRRRFDSDLRAAAVRAGAIVRNANARTLARHGDRWRVNFDDGSVHDAYWIVDATGRNASIARKLGARRERHGRHVAVYAEAARATDLRLDRTIVEAVRNGWWHATRLPSERIVAGFHTEAETALGLRHDSTKWRSTLDCTLHVGMMLRDAYFRTPFHLHDCSSARLSTFQGDGWIACGDAALSFDPLSGQGLHHAIVGGFSAAHLILAHLERNQAEEGSYSAGLEQAWLVYLRRHLQAYRSERRWSDTNFWRGVGEFAPSSAGTTA
jgi:flavin-dependent dehydrogenase